MNCEIFVLLEELEFISEALNCVCSGQEREAHTVFSEVTGTTPIILGVCLHGPFLFLSKTCNTFVDKKALGKMGLQMV